MGFEQENNAQDLKSLGNTKTEYIDKYSPALLESFDNKFPEHTYTVNLEAFEFSALCPKTGQPDFAKIHIQYVPDKKLVESKSLKLYLFSFRNHGSFHENVVNMIAKDLFELLKPRQISVYGDFHARGGIAIKPSVTLYNKELLQHGSPKTKT